MNVLFTFNLRTHTHKNAALQLAFSLVNKKKPFLNSFFFFFFFKANQWGIIRIQASRVPLPMKKSPYPLQYSCLKDRGAWQDTVQRVAKSRT